MSESFNTDMNRVINVMIMTDDATEQIRKDPSNFQELIKKHPENSDWLANEIKGEIFQKKKFTISDFQLKTDPNNQYSAVDFENSVVLWRALNKLPPYLLYDERFWLWILFCKGYQAAQQAMPLDSKNIVADHWLFGQSPRRSLFFGALSRCYLRVAMTVEEKADDPFKYTKWVIENPTRFRNLTWRNNSNLPTIVHGAIKAEYDFLAQHPDLENKDLFTGLAKDISQYGSVRLLDSLSEKEVYDFALSDLVKIAGFSKNNPIVE